MNISPAFKLPNIPAFGFEDLDSAVATRTDLWDTRLIRVFTIINRVIDIDGETYRANPTEYFKPLPKLYAILGTSYFTASKILGYIPINSIGVGIQRINYVLALAFADAIGACTTGDQKPTIANKKWHILRGLMEIACYGPILLLIDITVTRIRGQWKCQEDVANHPWLVL